MTDLRPDREQPEWVCPICGPTMMRDGVCVRHGTQADIDAEPDYAEWASPEALERFREREER
jgi:predicted RNA-binding Zn-ribbon protein involved in translation (DUF1610 family)